MFQIFTTENKTNWFPEGPDIKCFVVFLDSTSTYLNSNKKSKSKQSTRY